MRTCATSCRSTAEHSGKMRKIGQWDMMPAVERCSTVVSGANVPHATFRSGSTPGKPGHQPG